MRSRARLFVASMLVIAVGCQGGGETASHAPEIPARVAGVERIVDPLDPADGGVAADPDVEQLAPAPTTSTTTTSTSTTTTSTTLAPLLNPDPDPGAPDEPEPAQPAEPAAPAVPAGSWDAGVVRTAAGAVTSDVSADGMHVGPGRDHETISAAVASAAAGSTIVIHDNGDAYREAFSNDDGWIGKELRFVAAPGEAPVVSGADIVTAWSAEEGRWFHTYADDRFEFALPTDGNILPHQLMASAPAAGLLEQVVVDGAPLVQRTALGDLDPGSFFVDREADRIYLADDPTGRTVEITSRRRALMLASGASGSSIEGITITGFAPRHLDGKAMIVLDGATDVVLRDVVVTRSSATGVVAVDADRLRLERVSIVANGARGLSGDRLDDVVIRRSRFEGNNTEQFDWATCGGGTYCVLAGAKLTRSQGVEVSFSDFSDNLSSGFWCDLECRDLVFVANHSSGNARHGAYFEVSEGAVMEANILAGNGDAGIKTSGSRDVRIAHNTFFDNAAHVNIGADYRPGSIGFHTSEPTHMREIEIVDNVFAEHTSRIVVIDPVNHDSGPAPWDRVERVASNAYLLIDGEVGSDWRFRMADGTFELDPATVVEPIAVDVGTPSSHFAGGGLDDLLLVSAVGALDTGPLSAVAATFFPPLGALGPGAPLS